MVKFITIVRMYLDANSISKNPFFGGESYGFRSFRQHHQRRENYPVAPTLPGRDYVSQSKHRPQCHHVSPNRHIWGTNNRRNTLTHLCCASRSSSPVAVAERVIKCHAVARREAHTTLAAGEIGSRTWLIKDTEGKRGCLSEATAGNTVQKYKTRSHTTARRYEDIDGSRSNQFSRMHSKELYCVTFRQAFYSLSVSLRYVV